MIHRIHSTDRKAIRIPYSTSYKQGLDYKPKGLWYGIDWEWHKWCNSEGFDGVGKNNFSLELDMEKILVIDSPDSLRNFTVRFGAFPQWMMQNGSFRGSKDKFIDWEKVAKRYSGIEITPYLYKCRFEFMFYYGWDVASGCVWNLNAIKSVTQTTENPILKY
jgi:hypothetical protein